MLVANILAGPLISLAQELASRIKVGGQMALSGILSHQAEEVSRAYSPWFELDKPAQEDDWVRITGIRKDA